MRYPLSHDEIIEIADLYGTTEEIVVHPINDYEIEKEKEQEKHTKKLKMEQLYERKEITLLHLYFFNLK